MKAIVSGLVNIETNVAVKEFPIPYCPIDYSFFGVESGVGGVGYNIAKALRTLGDEVRLFTLTGNDVQAKRITEELQQYHIDTANVKPILKATPESVVLHDESGKRRIYCDLKDIQEKQYDLPENFCAEAEVFVLCNINFNRPLLKWAKKHHKTIATDVHTLWDIHDDYNKDFMECADILFLSDENLPCGPQDFLLSLARTYPARVIVMGRGENGVMYIDRSAAQNDTAHFTKNNLSADNGNASLHRDDSSVLAMPAVTLGNVVNTVGAGDALFSSFLHFYIRGMNVTESLKRAQIFAALKIQHNGAAEGFASEAEIDLIPSSKLFSASSFSHRGDFS